ncbi:MAG: [protein-PII] uridylyltransferase [Pirellulales bacterium]
MSGNLRPAVLDARRLLTEGHAKLQIQHAEGSPGIQVCAKLTDLADQAINDLFSAALDDLSAVDRHAYNQLENDVTLIAHAGYGRRELAPFSDIDLMFLHTQAASKQVPVLAERLLRDIFDLGVVLGHSVRTPGHAIKLACQDAKVFTSLSESRYVAGNEQLADKFIAQFRSVAARRAKRLLPLIDQERRTERRQFGETIYLLEPNIKRSRGGLRDIHLIRWVGFCCYGTTDLDGLYLTGALEKEEQNTIREATEFLLTLRNEVHFHARKAYDQLDRAEQLRLAELRGFEDRPGMMAVEQFMQTYFQHTAAVRYISGRFLANAYRRSRVAGIVGSLLAHRLEGDFLVGPYRIMCTRRGLKKIQGGDLSEVLRLAEKAAFYDKRIAHDTWEAVRRAAANWPSAEITRESARGFMSLLAQPAQLSRLLRRLHALGILEKLIPAFARTRGLLQFNEYHQYTVDEHSIRTVECATAFAQDNGPLGEIYATIKHKELLHLALLLHDLGKGYPEDHSEVGRGIAVETAKRLFLPKHESEVVEFLVHKHLVMTHLALWHDTSDPAVAIQLAREVGSSEVLRKLYILSAADLAGVGPDVLNEWKIELLTRLYYRTLSHLSDGASPVGEEQRLNNSRAAIADSLADESDAEWYQKQIAALPEQYLLETDTDKVATTLKRFYNLPADKALAWGEYQADHDVIEFTVGSHESITSGIFCKLSGALSASGVDILSAQINTLSGGLVLDRFVVTDSDFNGEPPPSRIEEIGSRLVEALENPDAAEPTFRKTFRSESSKASELAPKPVRVIHDNTTSERATILQVFASDRPGLLYETVRTINQLGLSVINATIGTQLDQVVDVFYVTDQDGMKLADEQQLEHICAQLLTTVTEFERKSSSE